MIKKINYKEWLNCSEEERHKIKNDWDDNWNKWSYLLEEAVNNFQKEYSDILNISSVDSCYGYGPKSESSMENIFYEKPAIAVTTLLNEQAVLDDIPNEYAHFPVKQIQFGDTAEWYLTEWKFILSNLLNWSEKQIINWANENHSEDLKGKNFIFTHETPSYYITHLLASNRTLTKMSSNERDIFLSRLEQAIRNKSISINDVPDYNWNAAKNRVNEVLKEIGESLP